MAQPSAQPELVVAPGGRFAVTAAEVLARSLATAIATNGSASVGFSGGSTVGPVFDELVGLALRDRDGDGELVVDWSRVRVTQVDERVVPIDHPDRNAAVLIDRLVYALPVPPAKVHLLPVELVDEATSDGGWLHESRHRLQEIIGAGQRLDIVQLGLGGDGHTASLVPGDPVLEVADQSVALTAPYEGHPRLTLTYPVLNAAGARVWWVRGAAQPTHKGGSKTDAMAQLMAGDRSVPAGLVERDNTVIVTDGVLQP